MCSAGRCRCGLGCGTSCSRSRWRFFGRRRARANVCEVLAHSHLSEKYWVLKNVISRRAAAISPFPFDIVSDIIGADLLAMAIDAAVSRINVRAALEHSRLRTRINIRPLFVGLRIETSDLPVRNDRETDPRKRKRAKDSQEKRSESFHQWPPDASASTGLRNVGTVDVRPNPSSIRPK